MNHDGKIIKLDRLNKVDIKGIGFPFATNYIYVSNNLHSNIWIHICIIPLAAMDSIKYSQKNIACTFKNFFIFFFEDDF